MDSYLLVSTWQGVFVVNPFTGLTSYIEGILGMRSWGLTWNSESLFICYWLGKQSVIVEYDLRFTAVDIHEPPPEFMFIAPHQIVWTDDRLWITDTQHDRIVLWDGKKDWYAWELFSLESQMSKSSGEDQHHINGCFPHEDGIWVVCHNNKKGSFVRKYQRASPVAILQEQSVGFQIHNIWPCNGTYVVCNSGRGRITDIDDNDIVRTGGFPRGVAATPENTFIGCSAHHFKCKSREDVDGSIVVLDHSLKVVHKCIMHGFGQIYEVRALNIRDKAHSEDSHKTVFSFEDLSFNGGQTCSLATRNG